jgi:hypothetical protein
MLLGIGGALVAVLAVWLYAYGASKPPEGPGARSLNSRISRDKDAHQGSGADPRKSHARDLTPTRR